MIEADTDADLVAILAHCVLMGRNSYETPEAFAKAILKRLAHEGWNVQRDAALQRSVNRAQE